MLTVMFAKHTSKYRANLQFRFKIYSIYYIVTDPYYDNENV